MHKKHKKHKNEQSGKLVVVGCEKVIIPLRDLPHRVEVHFKRKEAPPPCDPHNHHIDKLEYEVHRHYHGHCRNQYTLVIKWKVHDIREILWHVYYC